MTYAGGLFVSQSSATASHGDSYRRFSSNSTGAGTEVIIATP